MRICFPFTRFFKLNKSGIRSTYVKKKKKQDKWKDSYLGKGRV